MCFQFILALKGLTALNISPQLKTQIIDFFHQITTLETVIHNKLKQNLMDTGLVTALLTTISK